MEGIHLLADILQEGDWMVLLDLKNAYLTVPVYSPHCHFLQFRWLGRCNEFRVLPFGLCSAL